MSNAKTCLVYETLGKVTDLSIVEGAKTDDSVRLHGVFGVCGIKNGNNRIYSKENYGKMVENLQGVIATEGCLGELEHPNTMNINLENVSHKIESIEMNEDGTITGTIKLLNTPKGKIAQAIVEGGGPLFISSRGAGSIDESGNVSLTTLKTYDLVGTPGFAQAKMNLKENQTLECLNESLALIFEDDLLDKDDSKEEENKEEEPKEEEKKDDSEDKKEEENKEEDNKDNNNDKVTMEDLKKSIDELKEKVTSLEAELHVAQESLAEVKPVNYEAIEKWIKEEFAPEMINQFNEASEKQVAHIAEGVEKWMSTEIAPKFESWVTKEYSAQIEKWISEEYSAQVEKWITEHYSAEVEKWINEEYSNQVEKWITEEFAGTVETWINEEYSAKVNQWVTEEFAGSLDKWITEEFSVKYKEEILNEAYANVNAFMESNKANRLEQIDKMLEAVDSIGTTNELDKIVAEQRENSKYKGVYVVENMPSQYEPSWNGISEARQQEIIRSSRMYDFTKAGVLESFWANVDFTDIEKVEEKPLNENLDMATNFKMGIIARMKQLGNK